MVEKDKKPMKEALASVTDGLDILVGLDKKEEKEKPAETRPSDTFGGLFQSMIPLLILPQILPLFQQSLGQTLQSTTVNVKVESATALIPISIEAATAIVPIEIQASQVTLNVNIASQTTVLNVNIASPAVLNVTVQGTADIRVVGQQVGIIIEGTWRSIRGEEVNLINISWLFPFDVYQVISFSPTTEKYQIEAINAGYEMARDTIYRPQLVIFDVYVGADKVATLNLTAEKPTDYINLLRGISIVPGFPLSIFAKNQSPAIVRIFISVMMYRVD